MQITLPKSLTDRIGVKAARRRPDDTLTESAEFIAKLRHRWRINGIDHGMQWLLHKSAMKGYGILHKKRCEDDNARISSGQISHRLLPAIWECGRHVNHVDLPALKTQYRRIWSMPRSIGDWVRMEAIFITIESRIPRNATSLNFEDILEEMTMLREETLNLLEAGVKAKNLSTNDSQNDCHKQYSNTESTYEFDPCSENEQGANDSAITPRVSPRMKAFPLAMILQACPEIVNLGPTGSIDDWRELMVSAVSVRSMLGISPSAYEDACDVKGQENAAVVVACILERAGEINSAGGYLRDLTARAKRGEFSLGPVLMALLRSNGQIGGRAA